MHKADGFTLVELMVALAIVAILATLAAPSFSRLIASTRISGNVNGFLADMRYARSESIRRGGGVTLCRSEAPEAADPACADASGPGGPGSPSNPGWVSGWIVFHDLDNDGEKAPAETLLRVQSPITALNAIGDSNPGPGRFHFTATGRLLRADAATTLHFGSAPLFAVNEQRTVCVNPGGRARIAGDGNATCGASQ